MRAGSRWATREEGKKAYGKIKEDQLEDTLVSKGTSCDLRHWMTVRGGLAVVEAIRMIIHAMMVNISGNPMATGQNKLWEEDISLQFLRRLSVEHCPTSRYRSLLTFSPCKGYTAVIADLRQETDQCRNRVGSI